MLFLLSLLLGHPAWQRMCAKHPDENDDADDHWCDHGRDEYDQNDDDDDQQCDYNRGIYDQGFATKALTRSPACLI